MTTVYKFRKALLDLLPDVVPAGVRVDYGPDADQTLVGDFVWLGTSTDANQTVRAVSGPGRKWSETYDTTVRIFVGGEPDEDGTEERAGEIHCAIQEWLDERPRLYDEQNPDVVEGATVHPVPGLRSAEITRFEIDNGWTSTGGPIVAAVLTITVEARGPR